MASEHRDFWSRVAQPYDRVVDRQLGPKTRSIVRERVEQEDQLGRLAEFGCGTGYYTQVLAGKADTVIATDISPGMLALAEGRVKAANVTFQVEDCQQTSLPNEALDTVFMGLVIHFTEPAKALMEMRRILKAGSALIIANVDVRALTGLDRVRCLLRILYQGITGYRVRPPKGFGKHLMTERQLRELLSQSGFRVISVETIKDTSHSSSAPVEYVRAVKV